ncbi:MAG: PKD domain-containing protein [Bacteroidetes bacterium]|nr:MAG: PKD domain-containing protein [Bacteroidota bacterium]
MKKILLFLFVVMSLFVTREAEASHVMGSDIVYRCKGNGKYEITLRVYRDCNGIQVSQAPVTARCSSSTVSITAQTKVSVRDITGIDARCPIQSRCSGSFQYGVEEHIWKMEVDLSSYSCCEWTLSWEQCCRNGNITTGQANQNFFTTATLNKCVTPCNSSPDFTNPPVAIICANQDFVFNNGALDTIDAGDSLSYSLVPGLQSLNNNVTYTGQFSPTRPLTFFGFPNQNLQWPAGFRLDPTTGDLLFRPTQVNQVAIVVIEVKEWRLVNGQMQVVGRTRRDMQIIVVSCPNNNVPTIDPPYSVQACANQQKCINIVTDDDDPGDTVRISWNRGIPGATFTNNNGQQRLATGQVCWTPTDAHVSNIPYTFTVTARDDACPLAGQAVRAFSIFVRETPKADRNIQVLNCGKVALSYTPLKTYSGLTASWVIRDSLNRGVWSGNSQTDTAFLQPGVHRVFLTLQTSTPCINILFDSIIVPEFVQIQVPTDTFVCAGNQLNLNSTTINGDAPYEYLWTQIDETQSPVDSPSTDPNLSLLPDSTVRYVLRVKDDNGCYNWDTATVHYSPLPPVNAGLDERVCKNTFVTFDAGNDTMTLSYLWSNGDTTRAISVQDSNAYVVRVTDSMGCVNRDTVNLFVNSAKPELGNNRNICENDTITLYATNADSYSWYNLSGFTTSPLPPSIGTGASYFTTITQSVGFVVKGVQTYQGVSCEGFDTVRVTMNPLPEIFLNPQGPHCEDVKFVNLATYVQYPTLTNGTWRSEPNATLVNNNQFNVDSSGATPAGSPGFRVVYRVTDNRGCSNEAATFVDVVAKPTIVLKDLDVCGDFGLLALNNLLTTPLPGGQIGNTFSWKSADNLTVVNNNINTINPLDQKLNIANLPQGVTYRLLYSFTNNTTTCSNTGIANVRVNTVPNTDAGILTPKCWNEGIVDLSSANPSPAGGTWSVSVATPAAQAGFSNGMFNPTAINAAQFTAQNYYWFKYSYTSPEGCSKADSVQLMIKGIPDITITPLLGICEDSAAISLTNNANPRGATGVWTGTGVTSNMFDPAAAGAGFHQLDYAYTDPISQCSNTGNFTIEVQAKPEIQFTTPTASCAGEPFKLDVNLTNAPGILWGRQGDGEFDAVGSGSGTSSLTNTFYYPGNGDIAAQQFRIFAETTNPRYCQPARVDETIGIYPIPTASISADDLEGCNPHTVNLEAVTNTGQGVYIEWDFGDGNTVSGRDNQRNAAHTYTTPGQFNITLYLRSDTSVGACENTATPVVATIFPTPEAAMDANRWKTTVALPGVQFYDRSTIDGGGTINSWLWSFGDRNASTSTQQNPFFEYPITEPTDTGEFMVQLIVNTPDNCPDTAYHPMQIDPDITVFIPNAFTPNNFGKARNDRFYVVADGFESFEITIYTRWGEVVYKSADIEEGWDGMYKNVEAQQDVYVYYVKVTSMAGKEFEYYGTVTLLR